MINLRMIIFYSIFCLFWTLVYLLVVKRFTTPLKDKRHKLAVRIFALGAIVMIVVPPITYRVFPTVADGLFAHSFYSLSFITMGIVFLLLSLLTLYWPVEKVVHLFNSKRNR